MGQNVNQESHESLGKPILTAESFQRLLGAAYVLQAHHDRTPAPPIDKRLRLPFIAGAIVQSQPSSLRVRESRFGSDAAVPVFPKDRLSAAIEAALSLKKSLVNGETAEVIPVAPGRALPSVRPVSQPLPSSSTALAVIVLTFPRFINMVARRLTSWKTLDALVVATVFLTLMGVSVHRFLDVPEQMSFPVKIADELDTQPGAISSVATSSQEHIVSRMSRPAIDGGEADVVAEDVVIRYPQSGLNHAAASPEKNAGPLARSQGAKTALAKPGVRSRLDRGDPVGSDTVVQYGPDVKMWSRNPKQSR